MEVFLPLWMDYIIRNSDAEHSLFNDNAHGNFYGMEFLGNFEASSCKLNVNKIVTNTPITNIVLCKVSLTSDAKEPDSDITITLPHCLSMLLIAIPFQFPIPNLFFHSLFLSIFFLVY
uniref:Uncharacterized protein n=1 Tax=Cacopsylla melanoneura TaxID=428564 RepID=A0A8D9E594_9HEMI